MFDKKMKIYIVKVIYDNRTSRTIKIYSRPETLDTKTECMKACYPNITQFEVVGVWEGSR
jgi:hypothetical protein